MGNNMERNNIALPKKKNSMARYMPFFFMALPGLIYLIINNYLPMFGLIMAFKKVNFSLGILASPWCGLSNFKFLFATSDAWIATRNSILYNLFFIIANNFCGIFVAILLNEIKSKFFTKVYQNVFLLPYLISTVIISYIVYAFLSGDTGYINNTLLKGEGVSWYTEPKYWPIIISLVNIWRQTGYHSIIYFSSIIGIDSSLFEAATLDGASKWQQIKNITLPSLKPTIITLVLLALGRIFYSDFGLFYQVPMDSGALYPTTNVLDTFVYRSLMKLGNVGMASAAGFYQAVVGFCLVLLSNALIRKIDKENALF